MMKDLIIVVINSHASVEAVLIVEILVTVTEIVIEIVKEIVTFVTPVIVIVIGIAVIILIGAKEIATPLLKIEVTDNMS